MELYIYKSNQRRIWLYSMIRKSYNQLFRCVSAARSVLKSETVSKEEINIQVERMLNEYGNSILRLAYSYLKNMSDAEEILQETLIQFLKTAPTLESMDHEKAWLLRVAVKKIL